MTQPGSGSDAAKVENLTLAVPDPAAGGATGKRAGPSYALAPDPDAPRAAPGFARLSGGTNNPDGERDG